MGKTWDQSEIQRYIDNGIEESLELEYKGASALGKNDSSKREITKDVSAFANSAGGILIYGVAEFNDSNKKHMPEKIDPIDRRQFSKEWMQDVINNIRPRINGLVIHPIDISTSSEAVAYLVEIPQSNTAHQARDYRYYKRFNFQSVPMEDFEVRDVMNRGTTPDATVEFNYHKLRIENHSHTYRLGILITNPGIKTINHIKLEFTFPGIFAGSIQHATSPFNGDLKGGDLRVRKELSGNYLITIRSKTVLFPKDSLDIGREIQLRYNFNDQTYSQIRELGHSGQEVSIDWILHADNMLPKQGKKINQ